MKVHRNLSYETSAEQKKREIFINEIQAMISRFIKEKEILHSLSSFLLLPFKIDNKSFSSSRAA
ncbi:MAG: hypothetical protein CO012_07605 [Syntrophobacterales bacterium CG_4_8_14_3_um_filter_49_14]|nr:MAG: hypothetical protein COX52_06380 [Syntrophobacterales bacterium CG23_combo_of_CG06-09_8_20_14_all_48_27]PJC74009.1 MAG: hypothetical protein CO012_07605 [Syntrophobacterales bacterium CG_4_8_14_3_um_filter_49_14]